MDRAVVVVGSEDVGFPGHNVGQCLIVNLGVQELIPEYVVQIRAIYEDCYSIRHGTPSPKTKATGGVTHAA